MKKYLFLFTVLFFIGGLKAQNEVTLKSKSDTAEISIIDSTFFLKIDGKEYIKILKNKTVYLMGSADAWDDLRTPVNATTASGSNPPEFSSLQNSGGKFIGNAFYFDGIDDYDSIPATSLLNFSHSDFSIAFWIQPDPSILNDANIVYKKGGRNISIQNKKIRVYLEGEAVFLSNVELNMGARNFVVVSVNNDNNKSSLYVYINNKFAGKQTYDFPPLDNTYPLLLGKAEHKGYGNNYKGVLDEYNVWKKILTQAERDSLWNDSKGTQKIIAKSDHVFGFSFDDKSSSILSDNDGGADIKAYTANEKTTASFTEGLISETIISHGVFAYFFEKDINEELFFSAQLPHTWVEGTEIEPHVHYVRPTNDTGTVVWGLEYTWCNMGEEFPETKIIYAIDNKKEVAEKQVYTSFGNLNGEGKKISSMLMCRIFRDAENPLDTYNDNVGLLEVDFHILNNSLGSSPGMQK